MNKRKIYRFELLKRKLLKYRPYLAAMPFASFCLQKVLRRLPLSPELKIQFDLLSRPQLTYGIYAATLQAYALGHDSMTVIEFGVAAGDGLRCIENACMHLNRIPEFKNFKYDIYGFDIGNGMPDSIDPKDAVYWFEPGLFKVNTTNVAKKFKRAKYIIGDIKDTIKPTFHEATPPIGFISFDMDNYSSTYNSFKIFELPESSRLPRIICYMDDIFGISDLTVMGNCLGEGAAIKRWNAENANKQICKIEGLRHKRLIPQAWNDQMFCFHDFKHSLYNTGINPLY